MPRRVKMLPLCVQSNPGNALTRWTAMHELALVIENSNFTLIPRQDYWDQHGRMQSLSKRWDHATALLEYAELKARLVHHREIACRVG